MLAWYLETYTLTEYKAQLGVDRELNALHKRYSCWLIEKMTEVAEAGENLDNMVQLTWPSWPQLEQMEIREVVWTAPKERHMELAEYCEKHGDYNTNGRGDQPRTGPDGRALVLLAGGEKVWTKVARIVDQAVKRRQITDAGDEMAQLGLEQRWKSLADATLASSSRRGRIAAKAKARAKLAASKKSAGGSDDEDATAAAQAPSTPQKNDGSDAMWDAFAGELAGAARANASPKASASVPAASSGRKPPGKPKASPKAKSSPAQPKTRKPGGGGGGGGDGSEKKTKGAPKKNKMLMLTTAMEQLKASSLDVQRFFGPEWKTSSKRNWDEYP